MKHYIFVSGILLISVILYGQYVCQQSSLVLTGSDVKNKNYTLSGAMAASNTTETRTHKNQVIQSSKVKAIAEFNSSCMSEGLWVGSVVLAGTAERIIFRQAWGYTSVDKTVELSEDAVFDMASLTKPVATATALAICMDRGWVDISAPFTQYLPEYQGKLQGTVTVLDLARHLSGFDKSKPYLPEEYNQLSNLKEGPVIENLLYHSPVRPPKQKYQYTCTNYIMLGLIVEKVSRKSLSEFCIETIFDPLGMQDTQWTPLLKPDMQRVVKPIFTPMLGVVSDEPARAAGRPIGNAGLFSTADDLAKFCRMMLANGRYGRDRLLSERAMHALSIKIDTCSPVALGWRVGASGNIPSLSEATLSHSGFTGNSIWIDPVQQCFVIVLTNRTGNHGRASHARTELAEYLLKEMRKELGLSHGK